MFILFGPWPKVWILAPCAIELDTPDLDIRYHYVCECVQNRPIKLQYCPTNDMKVDVLTKPLLKQKFEDLRAAIGLLPF